MISRSSFKSIVSFQLRISSVEVEQRFFLLGCNFNCVAKEDSVVPFWNNLDNFAIDKPYSSADDWIPTFSHVEVEILKSASLTSEREFLGDRLLLIRENIHAKTH